MAHSGALVAVAIWILGLAEVRLILSFNLMEGRPIRANRHSHRRRSETLQPLCGGVKGFCQLRVLVISVTRGDAGV